MGAISVGIRKGSVERPASPRKLLSVETHFTLEAIRDRELEHSILCKDLGGFFDHVWTVHPFATLLTSEKWGPRYGKPSNYEIAPRHTFIEGKVGRFTLLRTVFALNFLLAQIGLFFALRRLINREEISLVRASNPLYAGLFGLLLARSASIPLVVRVGSNHDKHFEITGRPMEPRLMRGRRIEKFVERLVLSRADLVAGANQDNLDFALANGASPARSTLFRYGNLIDSRHFIDPQERSERTNVLAALGVTEGKFLLYVGRLEPIKQPGDVLDVLRRIRLLGFDMKAVLAGEGSMDAELKESARLAGIEKDTVFAGNLPQSVLALLYPASAAVVSPHTGRALTEAALAAAPVIAYDVDWQRELIETGVTGILVPHGDRDGLAGAVTDLVGDPARARAFGQALRARALEMFDPDFLNEHERREYLKVLERRSSRKPTR